MKIKTILEGACAFIAAAAATSAGAQQTGSGNDGLDAILSSQPSSGSGSAPAPNDAPAATQGEPAKDASPAIAGTGPDSGNAPPIDLPAGPDSLPKQAASKAAGGAIEEIVVTAQKRSESINNVPIAISAFTGENIKALGVTDTRDMGKIVPGFTVADSGYNTPVYTMRGVGFNDSTYTATATVGVYDDEISLPYAIMTKGMSLDMQRVEVLKGPQGILYGRNTTGGAINYIANKPTDTFAYGGSIGYSRFDTLQADGFINGKIADNLNGRFAFKDLEAFQGWQYSNTRPGDTLGKKDKQSMRGILDWTPTDRLDVRATLSGWRDHSQPQAAQVIQVREQNGLDPTGELFLPPQARDYPVISETNADPRVADWPTTQGWMLHDQFISGSLRGDWKMNDSMTLTGLFNQSHVDSDKTTLPTSGYNYNAFEQVLTAHIDTTSLETRLSGSFGEQEPVNWVVGGNVSRDRGYENHVELVDDQSALAANPVTGNSTLTNRVDFYGANRTDQYAFFANADWQFTDTLQLTLGGRFTNQNEHFSACAYVPNSGSYAASYDLLSTVFTGLSALDAAEYLAETGQAGDPSIVTSGHCFTLAANGSNAPFTDDLNESNFSYRAVMNWKPIDDNMFYASVIRGFKAGGFPVLGASGDKQFEPVKQERLQAFEVGSKSGFFDREVHLDTAFYYYDYRNKQLSSFTKDPVFGPLPLLENAPKSRVYGAELELKYAPGQLKGFLATLLGAYTNTEVTEYTGLNSKGNEYNFAGRPFNYAPRWQTSLLLNYSFDLGENTRGRVGVDYAYSDSTSASLDPDPIFRLYAHGILGAQAGVAYDRWDISAYGRNLTDKMYGTTILAFGDSVHRYTGEPLVFGMLVSYRFDQ